MTKMIAKSILLGLLFSGVGNASVVHIPEDHPTIQAGLDSAFAGDTILVAPGTYHENIAWPQTAGIKLFSLGDTSNTTIDGEGISSVITINGDSVTIDSTTQISGFQIVNGVSVFYGGGIALESVQNPVLADLLLKNNSAYYGGALSCNQASPIIENVVARGNTATEGGGLHLYNYSSPTISDIEVSYNSANKGGGVFCNEYSSPVIYRAKVCHNTASLGGGGIFNRDNGDMILSDSDVNHNQCFGTSYGEPHGGGGVYTGYFSNPLIENTNIIGNYSAGYGGGVKAGMSDLNIRNITLMGNSSNRGGAGIASIFSITNIENSRFIANRSGVGGGLYLHSVNDQTNVISSLFVDNEGNLGGAVYLDDCVPTFIGNTLSNNRASNEGDGVYSISSVPALNQNNICNNGVGYHNGSDNSVISLANNYWGDTTGPYHVAYNVAGLGDSTSMFTNPTPFLTEPSIIAPPLPIQNVEVTETGNNFVSLQWNSSPLPDLESYRLYYGTDTAEYVYENSIDLTTLDTSYTIDGLDLSTTYHFAVTSIDTAHNESWYSKRVTGTTRVVEVQNLDVAGEEELMHLTTHAPFITFDYHDSMGDAQTGYHVQLSFDSAFQNILWDSGIVSSSETTIQIPEGLLENGFIYQLRVRAGTVEFWSNWASLTFRMNTPPATPTLIAPIQNEVVTEPLYLSIHRSTDSENDILQYQYFVFDDNSREAFVDSSAWVSDTTWQITVPLADNNQYWWYARSFDGYEMSSMAQAESFLLNTENNAPSSFDLINPPQNGETNPGNIEFRWEAAQDPDPIDSVSYMLILDTPAPGIASYNAGYDTSFAIPGELADNTEYYWKVVAKDLLGFETESSNGYQRFTTNIQNEPPSMVDLFSPDSVILLSLSPQMIWSPSVDPDPGDIVSYELHWWGDAIEYDSILTDTNSIVLPYNVEDNTQYFWEVIAMDQTNGISHSDVSTFWTDLIPEAPGEFDLLAPEDGVVGLSNLPTFAWEVAEDPDPLDFATYTIQVSRDSSFSELSFQVDTELASHYEMNETLTNDTEYWWRVIATDTDSLNTVTSSFKFTVGYVSASVVEALPTEFVMQQNFPNPFNPNTKIKYGIPENTHVSIVVYDVQGRVIATLLNMEQSAGWYDVSWSGMTDANAQVATGLYFARIKAGSFTDVIKMVYLQ